MMKYHQFYVVLNASAMGDNYRYFYGFRQRLPSFLHRNAIRQHKKGKSPKITYYNRDVICLPQSYARGNCKSIPIPRKKARTTLAEMGLQGKISLRSDMLEEAINCEIRSAFADVMGHDPFFPFAFLQLSGGGSKTLTLPSLSSSFRWTAGEVGKLGKSVIYILAQRKLCNEDNKVCMY